MLDCCSQQATVLNVGFTADAAFGRLLQHHERSFRLTRDVARARAHCDRARLRRRLSDRGCGRARRVRTRLDQGLRAGAVGDRVSPHAPTRSRGCWRCAARTACRWCRRAGAPAWPAARWRRTASWCVSLARMRRMDPVDELGLTVRVQAGAVTEAVHQHAAPHGLTWPVDFASKGSRQVGGNIATNAGGVQGDPLRPDAAVGARARRWCWRRARCCELNGALEKNNTGVDLRQLFIGSEGTLGIITEATLEADAAAAEVRRAALRRRRSRRGVLALFRARAAGAVRAGGVRVLHRSLPRPGAAPSHGAALAVRRAGDALRAGRGRRTPTRTRSTPGWRRAATRGCSPTGPSRSRPSRRPSCGRCARASARACRRPGCRTRTTSRCRSPRSRRSARARRAVRARVPRLGDLPVRPHRRRQPARQRHEARRARRRRRSARAPRRPTAICSRWCRSTRGSISAEHGIGLLKKPYLGYSRSPDEIALLRAIKQALDPLGILNPARSSTDASVQDARADVGLERRDGLAHVVRHVLVDIHDQVADVRDRSPAPAPGCWR